MLEIFSINFMQNAFLASFGLSVACGIIGSLVVINKMSFVAGGLAHGAYGGIGIAFFLGISPILGAGIFSFILALIIASISLSKMSNIDAVIGALWAFGMAVGIIFIDLTPGYNTDLLSYLFGSILTVGFDDLYFVSIIDLIFLSICVLFYRQICAISFDIEFAKLRGLRVKILHYVIILMMALCVVGLIRIIGLILLIAMITIPPYIAATFSKNLSMMMFFSSIICACFCFIGLFFSYYLNLSSGASIVLVASFFFFLFSIKRKI